MINWEDLPKDCIKVFWKNRKERIGNMIQNLIESSDGKMIISMTPEFHKATDDLRTYLFQNVYQNAQVKKDEDLDRVEVIVKSLYRFFLDNPKKLPEDFYDLLKKDGKEEAVKDYIAGMTDRYALNLYTELFVPKGWKQII